VGFNPSGGKIANATDVALGAHVTLGDSQVLTYSASDGLWENKLISGAQALSATAVKTSAYTAAAGDLVPANATTAGFTVTLPTAPADQTRISIKKIDTSANVVTIACGGSDVFNKAGGSTSVSLSLLNQAIGLQYTLSSAIWYVVGDDVPLSQLDVRYTTPAAITTDLNNTDANIFWNGTGSCPLRTTGTTDTTRRVRWVSPVTPLTTSGYALPGDVWETVS
jgi:hypothetical protein